MNRRTFESLDLEAKSRARFESAATAGSMPYQIIRGKFWSSLFSSSATKPAAIPQPPHASPRRIPVMYLEQEKNHMGRRQWFTSAAAVAAGGALIAATAR